MTPRVEDHVEHIEHQENLPLRIFIHSVRNCASHHHRDCELLFVLRGHISAHTSAGDAVLGPDDLFFIHGHEIHLTRETIGTNLLAALQIETGFAMRLDPDFARRRFDFNRVARRQPGDPRLRKIREILAETLWEMRLRRPGYRLQVESLVLRLLAMLVREFPSTLVEPPSLTGSEEEEALGQRLARIVGYIEAHSSEELSSLEVAQNEKVSVSYLARLFKERLGTTFSDYVNLLRVKKALPLLARREGTILEIALACGFPSVKTFNIVFKRLHRTTPSRWQRSQAGTSIAGIGDSAYGQCDAGVAYHLLKKHLPASASVA